MTTTTDTTDGARLAFEITVYGTPGPQGSKAYKGHRTSRRTGRRVPLLVESSKKVKSWREAVVAAAQVEIVRTRGFTRLDGPLMAAMYFTLRRPATGPGRSRPYPTVYPDLDKLLRSTGDALSTAGVWTDDACLIRYRDAAKLYPGTAPVALDKPGAIIRIWQVTE